MEYKKINNTKIKMSNDMNTTIAEYHQGCENDACDCGCATSRVCLSCREDFTPSKEHKRDMICDECVSEKGFSQHLYPTYTCCLCDKECQGFGNNPAPIKKGKCCDDCNSEYVIPIRIMCMTSDVSNQQMEIFASLAFEMVKAQKSVKKAVKKTQPK